MLLHHPVNIILKGMQPNQEVKGYLEKLMKQHPDMEKIGQSLQ